MDTTASSAHATSLNSNLGLPKCRTCKRILDSSSDHMKTRDKWWTNCLSCRTTNTTKRRAKCDAGLIPGRRGERQRPIPTKRSLHQETGTQIEETKRHKALHESVDAAGDLLTDDETILHECAICKQEHWSYECPTRSSTVASFSWGMFAGYEMEDDALQYFQRTTEAQDTREHECSVCDETTPDSEFADLTACKHDPDVCKPCFLSWLTTQLDSTSWEQMQCPSTGCSETITHQDVQKHAPRDIFVRSVRPVQRFPSVSNTSPDSTSSPRAAFSATTQTSITVRLRDVSLVRSTTRTQTGTFSAALLAATVSVWAVKCASTRTKHVRSSRAGGRRKNASEKRSCESCASKKP
jgi:hypothetical protein